MRRILLTLVTLTFLLPQSSAHSTTVNGQQAILITDSRHRDLDGNFLDTSLEGSLNRDGDLSRALDTAQSLPLSSRVIFIDPMLVEEVQDLADGYRLVVCIRQRGLALLLPALDR